MRVTIVSNGTDDLIDLWNNPWGKSLDDRVSPLLSERGYQVLAASVDYSYGVGVIGLALPYQLTVTLETNNQPATVDALVKLMREVITQAVGDPPASVAVTSAGQPAPAAPSSAFDDVLTATEKLAQGLGVTVDTAKLIIAALGVGAVVLILIVATQPERGGKLLKGLR